jgi:hypothetical protein
MVPHQCSPSEKAARPSWLLLLPLMPLNQLIMVSLIASVVQILQRCFTEYLFLLGGCGVQITLHDNRPSPRGPAPAVAQRVLSLFVVS